MLIFTTYFFYNHYDWRTNGNYGYLGSPLSIGIIFGVQTYEGGYIVPDLGQRVINGVWYKDTINWIVPVKLKTLIITSGDVDRLDNLTSLEEVFVSSDTTYVHSSTFLSCSSLKRIYISKHVTSIVRAALDVEYIVDSENETYSSHNGMLFNKDKTAIYYVPTGTSGNFAIPNSVSTIGNYTFSGCSLLTSIDIPSSVTSIEAGAFCSCISLTSITIPSGVSDLTTGLFTGCSSLAELNIPNSVTHISESVFQNCSSLTSINYSGSQDEWKSIKKEYWWLKDSSIRYINCSDGVIEDYLA